MPKGPKANYIPNKKTEKNEKQFIMKLKQICVYKNDYIKYVKT